MDLLKIGDVSGEGEVAVSKNDYHKIKKEKPIEQLLNDVIEHLSNFKDEGFYKNLTNAINKCKENNELVYILINEKFNALNFIPRIME